MCNNTPIISARIKQFNLLGYKVTLELYDAGSILAEFMVQLGTEWATMHVAAWRVRAAVNVDRNIE